MKQFPERSIEDAAEGLRAIAHEVRLAILCYLADRPMNVSELVEATGTSQSNLSQHLAKMRLLNIVVPERRGTQVYYRLAQPGFKRVIKALQSIYCPDYC
ncbi:MAG: ArsR family transcriptional regulator [Gammaproteobacteria bacterium]|nr:MAG: ArsR family transcriptional regulator [Gammaproteobacteria bacterium]